MAKTKESQRQQREAAKAREEGVTDTQKMTRRQMTELKKVSVAKHDALYSV